MHLETPSSNITLQPNGIVVLTTIEGWDQPDTLEGAKANIAALQQAIGGQRRGLMSHLPNTHIPKEVLEYYKTANPGQVATALVTSSFGAKVIGNLYMKVVGKSQKEPIKLFTKETEAEAWLLKIMAQEV